MNLARAEVTLLEPASLLEQHNCQHGRRWRHAANTLRCFTARMHNAALRQLNAMNDRNSCSDSSAPFPLVPSFTSNSVKNCAAPAQKCAQLTQCRSVAACHADCVRATSACTLCCVRCRRRAAPMTVRLAMQRSAHHMAAHMLAAAVWGCAAAQCLRTC